MQLAIIGDDSLPQSTLVHAKMLHELALYYKEMGFEPVIISPGRADQSERLVIEQIDNIAYWRFRSGKLRGKGKFKRAINETLLSAKAWLAIRNEIKKQKFDGVIYYSPSIFFGYLAYKIKTVCKCKAYLILRDMFPQWAVDEGLIKQGSFIEKYFRFFERLNYSSADCVGLMSVKNLELFEKYNGKKYNTEVLYNWADKNAFPSKSRVFGLRERFNLTDKVIFFYGGNLGHAQDMGNLLRLADAMMSIDSAHFIFLGQGDEVDLVKDVIESNGLINCLFLPSVSQQDYKLILNEVDIGLFSLSAKHSAHNFPGKLLGYMVHSLPILGSVNQGNDLADVIHGANAGYIFNNGDDYAFFESAKKFATNESLRKKIGQNSNSLLLDSFSVDSAAKQIIELFVDRK